MQPSEVRRRVLKDHTHLRGVLLELESTARRVQDGDVSLASALRAEGQGLLDTLLTHMSWEERFLAPALARADAWGKARVEKLLEDHREQRTLLDLALQRLADPSRPPLLVARDLLALVDLLRTTWTTRSRTCSTSACCATTWSRSTSRRDSGLGGGAQSYFARDATSFSSRASCSLSAAEKTSRARLPSATSPARSSASTFRASRGSAGGRPPAPRGPR